MFVALNEARKRIFAQKDLPTDVPYIASVKFTILSFG